MSTFPSKADPSSAEDCFVAAAPRNDRFLVFSYCLRIIEVDNHNPTKKVMVFGVFDRLHPGHISFLDQAAQYGTELIAVVTRDAMVYELKKKMPLQKESARMRAVQKIAHVHRAVLGDPVIGSYDVIHAHMPDIICLGYDQHEFSNDLKTRIAEGKIPPVEMAIMESFDPDRFHTSLLTD